MATAGSAGGGSGRVVSGVRVGVGYVEIRPKAVTGEFTKLRTQMTADMRGVGQGMGEAIGRALESALNAAMRRVAAALRTQMAEAGRGAGQRAGAEFARAFNAELRSVERQLGRFATRLEVIASRSARVFSRAYGRQVGGAIQSMGRAAERVHERVGDSAEAAAQRIGGAFRLQYTRAGAAAVAAGQLGRESHESMRRASADATRGIVGDHARVTQSARVQSRLARQAWVQSYRGAARTAGRMLTSGLTAAHGQAVASARAIGNNAGRAFAVGTAAGTAAAAPQVAQAARVSMLRPIAVGMASVGQTMGQDLAASLRRSLAAMATGVRAQTTQAGTRVATAFQSAWTSQLTRGLLGDLRLISAAVRNTLVSPMVTSVVGGFAAIRNSPNLRGIVGDIRLISTALANSAAGVARPYLNAFGSVRNGLTSVFAPIASTISGHVATAANYVTSRLVPTFQYARTFAASSSAAAGQALAQNVGAGARTAGNTVTTSAQTSGAALASTMQRTSQQAATALSQNTARGATAFRNSMSSAFGYVGNALTAEMHRISNTAIQTGQILNSSITQPFLRLTEAAVKMGTGMGDELVSLQRRMLGMGISTERSGQAIKELNDFAAKTPYTFKDMAEAMPKFLDSGFGLERAKTILMQFSDYAASIGVTNASKYARALKGLTDVITMGVVKTQDMNQMSQNGVNAWQALADKMGVSIGELRKRLANGEQIASQTLLDALAPKFAKASGAAVTASNTITGAWDNMKEKLRQTFADMFVSMNTQGEYVYTPLAVRMQRLIELVDRLAELALPLFISALTKIVPIAEVAAEALGNALEWLRDAPGWVQDLATGLAFLGPVMMIAGTAGKLLAGALGLIVANPVVAAVLAVAAALVILYRNSEEFREIVQSAWSTARDVVSTAWTDYLRPAMRGVSDWWGDSGRPAVSAMRSAMSDAWGSMSRAASTAWTNHLRPAMQGLASWWSDSGRSSLAGVPDATVRAWNSMGEAVSSAWTGQIQPALTGIYDFTVNRLTPAMVQFWDQWIRPVVDAVIPVLIGAWETVLRPTLGTLAELLTTVVVPAMQLTWDIASFAFGGIAAVVSVAWTTAIQPTLSALAEFLGSYVIPILNDLWRTGNSIFTWLGMVVGTVWATVISPSLDAIVKALGFVMSALQILWEIAEPILRLLGWAVETVWSLTISPALKALDAIIRNVLGPTLKWLYFEIAKPMFDAIGSAISWAWDWIISPALLSLSATISAVGTAFELARDVIVQAWDKLKSVVSEPIRATIQWVNDHLIGPENGNGGGINKFLSYIGAHVPNIPIPFADGGIVPGYAPGRDSVPAILAPGEGVLRPEVVRQLGPARILAWNAAAAAGRLQKFGFGGIVGDVWDGLTGFAGDAWDFVEGLAREGVAKAIAPIVRGAAGRAESWARGRGFAPWGVTVASAPLRWAVQPILDWVKGRDSGGDPVGVLARLAQPPAYAAGGFVTSPTLAMVGEAGPELVLPLTRPHRMAELMKQAGLFGGGHNITVNAAPSVPTERQIIQALRMADAVYAV